MDADAEYSEILTSLRHYSNIRFAVLTLFSAINGALFSATFGTSVEDTTLRAQLHHMWPSVGVVTGVVFFLMVCCITSFVITFRRRASEIFSECHFNQTPLWSRRLARYIFKSLYLAMTGFWLAILYSYR